MAFNLGPQVPGAIFSPEDEEQQKVRPLIFPRGDREGRIRDESGGGLSGDTRSTSGSLAQSVLGVTSGAKYGVSSPPEDPRAPLTDTPSGEQRLPPPTGRSVADDPATLIGIARQGFQQGNLMVKAGAGSAITSLGTIGGGAGRDVVRNEEGEYEMALSTMQEYGNQVRANADTDLKLLQKDPEGWVQYAVGVVTAMAAPMAVGMAVAGTVGLAIGTGGMSLFVQALVGAAGGVYFVERASMQTQMEESGVDAESAAVYSALAAVPIAAAEAVLPGRGLARGAGEFIGETVVPRIIRKRFVDAVTDVAKDTPISMVIEAGTEAAQNVASEFAVSGAQGEFPDAAELVASTLEAAKAGAVGGIFYGAGFGIAGEIGHEVRGRRSEAEEVALRAQARKFDPDAVPEGSVIVGRRVMVDKNGVRRWFDVETNKPVAEPSAEDVESILLGEVRNLAIEERVEHALAESEPMDVPVVQAAAEIAELSDTGVSTEQVETQIRGLAVQMASQVTSIVNTTPKTELEAQMADLEAMAVDPNSGASHSVRISAIARKRAIEFKLREKVVGSVADLDVTVAARGLAALDDNTFEGIASEFESRGKERELRVLSEARALKEAGTVERETDEVNKLLDSTGIVRNRGLVAGSQISTPDGRVGEVLEVRPSGFLMVKFEGETEIGDPVDPAELNLTPIVGQKVSLATGQVADVLEVNEGGVIIRLPNDSQATIRPEEIERLGTEGDSRAALEVQYAEQRKEAGAEPRQALPTPLRAVDKRSGKTVQVAEIGEKTVSLTDGTVLSKDDLTIGGGSRLLSDIRKTRKIPTFEPGTQPSSKDRHINFLTVPNALVKGFRRMVRGKKGSVAEWLASLPKGGGLFLLPQPQRSGSTTFAIELPADARTLTDASKKILGFLGKKKGVTGVNSSTLRGRVRLARTIVDEEIGVMEVPDALMAVVQDGAAINRMTKKDLRAYVRRITDLGFDIDAEVGAAYNAAKQSAAVAAGHRVAGRLGEAELAEIAAQTARTEAAQVAIEQEIRERREVWENVKELMNESLTPRERTTLDDLNASNAYDLLNLGITPETAAKIKPTLLSYHRWDLIYGWE